MVVSPERKKLFGSRAASLQLSEAELSPPASPWEPIAALPV